MWEHLHTSVHRSSAAICGRDEKSEVYYNRGLTPVNPGRKWDKAKENGVWLKLFYSTPVSALSSRCEWHGLASCWNVNRHATHTLITPNNPLHCYLPFNSQLSVWSYSVAPHNPCVLFSLLWQACVRFHLLPLLACDRVVKNLPEAGGDKSLLKCLWPPDKSLSASGLLSPQQPVAIIHQQGCTESACTERSRFPKNWEPCRLSECSMHITRLSRKLVSDWLVMAFWISQSVVFLKG